jgi:uncharacterized membrane protein YfcA
MKHFVFCILILIVIVSLSSSSTTNYNKTCELHRAEQCEGEFICVKDENEQARCLSCTYSEQCEGYPIHTCVMTSIRLFDELHSNETLNVNQCIRKHLFHSGIWRDIAASILCFIGVVLSSSSGIGSGGLNVPILLIVAGYTAQYAVPLSTIMIFGSSIANFIILVPQKHPRTDRPIIDYTTALILEPIILCGTTIGIMLNIVLPNWILVIFLLLLLIFTSIRTFIRGISVFKSERLSRLQERVYADDPDLSFFSKNDIIANDTNKDNNNNNNTTIHNKNEENEEEEEVSLITSQEKKVLRRWKDIEKVKVPILIWLLLAISWIFIFVVSLLKGSGKSPSIVGVVECSTWYWILTSIQYPVLFGISVCVAAYMHYQYRQKVKLDYQFEQGDIQWKLKNAIFLPIMFLSAGLVAGLLGIGGGIITGPLLLELGMIPQVAVATSTFMIFFTASSTVSQFALMDQLPWDYSLWYIGVGILAGIIGQFVIGYLIKKFNRYSWTVFLTSILIGISAIMMGGVGIYTTVDDIKQGRSIGFRPLCMS